jgi:Tol biopolymer transport system component
MNRSWLFGKRRLVALMACAAGFVLVGSAAPAGAAVPGANGRIVFARAKCGDTSCRWWLISATPRDRFEHVLAGPYPDGSFDEHLIGNPSPDGRRVVFMVKQGIWMVNTDGSHLHRIFQASSDPGVDDGPTFTPDGKHIIFVRCCPEGFGYSLWRINPDGSGLKDVTVETVENGDGPADTSPQVSPDGRLIVFNHCFPDGGCGIATVHAWGGPIHDLPIRGDVSHPNWSPDGRHIIFIFHEPNNASDIGRVNRYGRRFRLLTHTGKRHGAINLDACYSPDGTKIMFVRFPTPPGIDLFVMRADGSHAHVVRRTGAIELLPQWAVRRS